MAKPKVLIADDERLIADTLALILNQGGFEARVAYNCEEALGVAPSFQPDILISDVLMADWNGVDAAIEMRVLLPDLRVFLLSGQTAQLANFFAGNPGQTRRRPPLLTSRLSGRTAFEPADADVSNCAYESISRT